MITVIFYFFILISSTLFVYISEKGKGYLERFVFTSISFLLIFIPPAIRFDVGADYINYLNIYRNLESYKDAIEPGYYFINWILNSFNAQPQWVFVLSAFIFSYAVFKSYPKKGAWILHYCVITMLWFFSFNIMRQSIAIAFCLLAVFKFFENKPKQFFAFSLFASLFHVSALVIVITGLIAMIPLRKSIQEYTLPSVFVVLIALSYVSVGIVVNYIEQILSFTGFSDYIHYFEGRYFTAREGGSGLGILATLLVCVYFILKTPTLLKENRSYWIIILLTFLYAISTILAGNIRIFSRMQAAFILSPIIMPYLLLKIPAKKQTNLAIVSGFIFIATYTFFMATLSVPSSTGDSKLNPFKVIFFHPNYY